MLEQLSKAELEELEATIRNLRRLRPVRRLGRHFDDGQVVVPIAAL